jgi:hypothetical protein
VLHFPAQFTFYLLPFYFLFVVKLRVRESPSLDGASIGLVTASDCVLVCDVRPDDWIKVRPLSPLPTIHYMTTLCLKVWFEGGYAYMLSVAPNGLTLLEKATRTYSVCDELPQGVQLRIRAKPRTDADTIGVLGYGGRIEVYGLEGDWLKVRPSLSLFLSFFSFSSSLHPHLSHFLSSCFPPNC